MRTTRRRISCAALLALLLVVVPMPAGAYELSGGVGMGGILAGAVPRLAVSPHAGLAWRMGSGFLFAVHDLFSILLTINKDGAGVYNQTAAAVGYGWENGN